jgi:hypothetical protein
VAESAWNRELDVSVYLMNGDYEKGSKLPADWKQAGKGKFVGGKGKPTRIELDKPERVEKGAMIGVCLHTNHLEGVGNHMGGTDTRSYPPDGARSLTFYGGLRVKSLLNPCDCTDPASNYFFAGSVEIAGNDQ